MKPIYMKNSPITYDKCRIPSSSVNKAGKPKKTREMDIRRKNQQRYLVSWLLDRRYMIKLLMPKAKQAAVPNIQARELIGISVNGVI
jgi:hypothetical protein